MLKDITIGQYLPGNSVIHRIDPRTKIGILMLFIVTLFTVNSFAGYLLCALFVIAINKMASIPFKMIVKSLKPIFIFLIFTAVINLFMTSGKIVFSWGIIKITEEGIILTLKMLFRLVFLIAGTSVLTYTTSPIVLTDGIENLLKPIEKIKVPAHEIAMMMTIALRFIPTIIEETDKIMKAQSARGSDFESGNILQRAKALVPILVPLFISSFRRADDLAVAMECRCYRGGENRTKMRRLKMTKEDLSAWTLCVLLFAAAVIFNFI